MIDASSEEIELFDDMEKDLIICLEDVISSNLENLLQDPTKAWDHRIEQEINAFREEQKEWITQAVKQFCGPVIQQLLINIDASFPAKENEIDYSQFNDGMMGC